MRWSTVIIRNVRRTPLRSALTALGIATVIVAFNLIVTTVEAWRAGAADAAPNRLIVRHAASLSIHLPLAYRARIAAVDGVVGVSYANWFGGVYRDAKGFFPQFAVEPASFLDLHPEVVVPQDARDRFLTDRRGALIGRTLADLYGWKVGDIVPLSGTLYPGAWELSVSGIYRGAKPGVDENWLLLRWDHMNERRVQVEPDRAGTAGWYIVQIADPSRAAAIAQDIDRLFSNSTAETRTETEQAFQLGFVAMSGALISAMSVLAFVINGLTLLVVGNALVLAIRERTRELGVLVALGFQPRHLCGLIVGEALAIGALGAVIGIAIAVPACAAYGRLLGSTLGAVVQQLSLSATTLLTSAALTIAAAVVAAFVPIALAVRTNVLAALRHSG
ncbi:MAG: FtsX-like permease family protein [Nitrospiraceae bacterium]